MDREQLWTMDTRLVAGLKIEIWNSQKFAIRLAHVIAAMFRLEEQRYWDGYRVHEKQKDDEREDAVEQQFVEHILVQVLLVEPTGERQH